VNCRVCGGDHLSVLIDDPAPGLTSLAVVWPHATTVRLCEDCGHLSTESFPGSGTYYDAHYETVSGEDDDLLSVDPQGQPVYRVQQQCARTLELVDVGTHGRLLDFGCGHGVFMRRFLERRPQWEAFGYEVSDRYAGPNISIGELPDEQFDLITSFYVFEHLEDPVATASELRRRLSDTGTLFLAVPDTVANPIDVLAADHLSHFGPRSLRTMLDRAGLVITATSRTAMAGTWLVAARHAQSAEAAALDAENGVSELGRYWAGADRSLKRSAGAVDPRPASVAVYGAGVYGAYMKARSGLPADAVRCFVDRNPRKHGTTFHGLPVRDLDGLAGVDTVLMGLRPDQAEAVAATPELHDRHCICLPAWTA
jgi:hypothetical protein